MSVNLGPWTTPACLRCGSDHCEHAMAQLLIEADELCERLGTSLERELSILRERLDTSSVDKHAAKSDNRPQEPRSVINP